MTEVHVVVRTDGDTRTALRAFAQRAAAHAYAVTCTAAVQAYRNRLEADQRQLGMHPSITTETLPSGQVYTCVRVPHTPSAAYVEALRVYSTRLLAQLSARQAWAATQPDPEVTKNAVYHVETLPFREGYP